MEHYQEDDLARLRELLRHTSEFIAYFELAEIKMIEWRQEIQDQAAQIQEYTQTVRSEINMLQELLAHSGIASLRDTLENALSQGEANRLQLEQQCYSFNSHLNMQREKLHDLTAECIIRLEDKTAAATQLIQTQLSKYDGQQFHRIASESCDHVARVAHNTMNKSNKLLSLFQFRFGLFAVFTTCITAFVIVLYLSDELPWELHHQAKNERQAGRVLLQAWPKLTKEEKAKILSKEGGIHGG